MPHTQDTQFQIFNVQELYAKAGHFVLYSVKPERPQNERLYNKCVKILKTLPQSRQE